jgi:two-component sensor histidine kinase
VYRHRRLIHLLAPLAPARDRLIAAGAGVFLPTQVITMVSLVLYELGTNALKYGAWSAPKGVVRIGWLARDGAVTVEWREHDGPSIKTPHTLGAGAKLIRTAIPDAVVDYRLEMGLAAQSSCRSEKRYPVVSSLVFSLQLFPWFTKPSTE